MAATVLGGLVLNALLHWWWAEHLAALVFLFWLVGEMREAVDDARGGASEERADEGLGALLSAHQCCPVASSSTTHVTAFN